VAWVRGGTTPAPARLPEDKGDLRSRATLPEHCGDDSPNRSDIARSGACPKSKMPPSEATNRWSGLVVVWTCHLGGASTELTEFTVHQKRGAADMRGAGHGRNWEPRRVPGTLLSARI